MKRFVGCPQEEFIGVVIDLSSLKNSGWPETARHGKKDAADEQSTNEKEPVFPETQIPVHTQ